jgi:hypothetical protein
MIPTYPNDALSAVATNVFITVSRLDTNDSNNMISFQQNLFIESRNGTIMWSQSVVDISLTLTELGDDFWLVGGGERFDNSGNNYVSVDATPLFGTSTVIQFTLLTYIRADGCVVNHERAVTSGKEATGTYCVSASRFIPQATSPEGFTYSNSIIIGSFNQDGIIRGVISGHMDVYQGSGNFSPASVSLITNSQQYSDEDVSNLVFQISGNRLAYFTGQSRYNGARINF